MNREIQALYFYDKSFYGVRSQNGREALKKFFSFCAKPFDQVEETDIHAWINSMEQQAIDSHLIFSRLLTLKSFYRYCMEEKKLTEDPTLTVKFPKVDKLPKLLSQEEITQLKELTRTDKRAQALIELLCTTCLRVEELLIMKLSDVIWEYQLMWIPGISEKQDFLPFTDECSALLKSYLNERKVKSDYLFCNKNGEKLDMRFLQKQFGRYSNMLGFPVSPHRLRHLALAQLRDE